MDTVTICFFVMFFLWVVTALAWLKLYRESKSLLAMNNELLSRLRERGGN